MPNFDGFLPKGDAKLIGRSKYLNKTSDPFECQGYQRKTSNIVYHILKIKIINNLITMGTSSEAEVVVSNPLPKSLMLD